MNSSERLTSQKKIILEYLKETKSHPSADMVYQQVRKKLPRISKATVYRILRKLKRKGEVIEIPSKPSCRYDGDTSFHAHFFCKECGRMFDILDPLPDFSEVKKVKAGKVKKCLISFYGTCKQCQKE